MSFFFLTIELNGPFYIEIYVLYILYYIILMFISLLEGTPLIVGFNLSLRNMAKTPTGGLDSQLLAARCCADADRVFGYQLETRS